MQIRGRKYTMKENSAKFHGFVRRWPALAFALLMVAAVTASGCTKLRARDQLNKGVANFRDGHYDAAIENFKASKEFDPDLINARVYLATAYAAQYIPGAPSDENVRVGEQAVAEFQDVLKHDPSNIPAIDGLGSILFQMAGTPFQPDRFLESKKYHEQHISLSPNDADPYYWVGVVNWTLARRANDELRQAYNLENPRKQIKDPDPLPDKLRAQFSEQDGALVDEASQMLDKAMQLRPDYADAIAYKSLVLRMKADMSDATTRASLEKEADDLLNQVKAIKQKEAAEKAAKG
jgi:tetratricopeptide (TPR) repeat protein